RRWHGNRGRQRNWRPAVSGRFSSGRREESPFRRSSKTACSQAARPPKTSVSDLKRFILQELQRGLVLQFTGLPMSNLDLNFSHDSSQASLQTAGNQRRDALPGGPSLAARRIEGVVGVGGVVEGCRSQ